MSCIFTGCSGQYVGAPHLGVIDMKSALLIHASPLGTEARIHALAEQALDNLRRRHVGLRTIYRDLSQGGFGWIGPDYANAVVSGAAPNSPEFLDSEALIAELEQTDALIISTPMHNYTVPASLKLWVDLVLRAGRSFGFRDGRKVGLLKDRPTLILVASGESGHSTIRSDAAGPPDPLYAGHLRNDRNRRSAIYPSRGSCPAREC